MQYLAWERNFSLFCSVQTASWLEEVAISSESRLSLLSSLALSHTSKLVVPCTIVGAG